MYVVLTTTMEVVLVFESLIQSTFRESYLQINKALK